MSPVDLFLARHGNTFEDGQKIVWVGNKDNPPLTKHGQDQARTVAQFLVTNNAVPKEIYFGPLQRTTQFAAIIAEELKFSGKLQVHQALNELDYGSWNGKTNDEIIALYGEKVFRDWDESGIWPKECGWGSDEQTLLNETKNFIESVKHSPTLAITSNGRLRFFARLAGMQKPEKVKTGHVCKLQVAASIQSSLWNIKP